MQTVKELMTIIVADDSEYDRDVLKNALGNGFQIIEAENGTQVLDIVFASPDSISAIFTKLALPRKDGFNILLEMKETGLLDYIPVFVITESSDMGLARKLLELGAEDCFFRPCDLDVMAMKVKRRTEAYVERRRILCSAIDLNAGVKKMADESVGVLSSLIEHNCCTSSLRFRRIRLFMNRLLREILAREHFEGLSEKTIPVITDASVLYDVGKLLIPYRTFFKKNTDLNDEEKEIIRSHTMEGARIAEQFRYLRREDYMRYLLDMVRYHHERFDGKGYPDGIKGNRTPVWAQAVGLVDAYEALTNNRDFRPAYNHESAVSMIFAGECGVFSPLLLDCLQAVAPDFAEIAHNYSELNEYMDEEEAKAFVWSDMTGEPYRIRYDRYLDLSMMEETIVFLVDFEKNTYRMLYPGKKLFEGFLGEGDLILDTQRFIQEYVHPEDRQRLGTRLQSYVNSYRLGQSFQGTGQYRIFSNLTGDYVMSEITFKPHEKVAFMVLRFRN